MYFEAGGKMNFKLRQVLMALCSLVLATGMFLTINLALAKIEPGLTRLTTASSPDRYSKYLRLNDDGTKVVFESNSDFLGQGILVNQGEIWLYNTATMTLTRITTASAAGRSCWYPDLNADGTKIVFMSDSDFLGQGIPEDQHEIWLYNTATLTVTRITTTSAASQGAGNPALSADGTRVAFDSEFNFWGQPNPLHNVEVWLYDTTTMTFTRVTTAAGGGFSGFVYRGIDLSANGSIVAFTSDADFLGQGISPFQNEIWLYDTATMTVTRITTASALGRDSKALSLSADGKKVAFESDSDFLGQGIADDQYEIWLYDTKTMTVTRVTTASAANRASRYPDLSADGTKVTFESDSDFLGQGIVDNQYEIWLYDTRTMRLTRLTTASTVDRHSYNSSVSADGSRVAFFSDSDFLNQGIQANQDEIWLFSFGYTYLPVVLKNH